MALASFHASQALAREGEFSAARPHGPGPAPAASKAVDSPERGPILPRMKEIIVGVTFADLTFADIIFHGGPSFAAVGVWIFGAIMIFQNWRRERKADAAQAQAQAQAAEGRKATEDLIAQHAKDAAEDRKSAQERANEDRKLAREQIAQHAEQAAKDRKSAQERANEDRKLAREQIAQHAEQAAEDRRLAREQKMDKVAEAAATGAAKAATPNREEVKGLLEALKDQGAALELQGKALEEILRRTDPDPDPDPDPDKIVSDISKRRNRTA